MLLIAKLAVAGNNFFMATNEEGKLFGCYLAYDENSDEHVRAGKSTNVSGYIGRWAEHRKRAESDMNGDDCVFYDLFPSKKSVRSKSKHEGLFEDLMQYIAAGFDGEEVARSRIFEKDYPGGGIFFYLKRQEGHIKRTKFGGGEKMDAQKYSEMVTYLFELAFDLALGTMNISGSTGLEGCGLNL